MLAVLGGFAEAFINPITVGLVLALGFLLIRPARLRLAAASVGIAVSLPGLHPVQAPLDALLVCLGGAAAGLLYAECVLFFVLPACRLALRLSRLAWRYAALVVTPREHPKATSAPRLPERPQSPSDEPWT